MVPNSVLLSLVVVPLREPDKVDVRVRFGLEASPRQVEERLLRTISVPTRTKPSVSLEQLDADGVVFRVTATPLRAKTARASPTRCWRRCAGRNRPRRLPEKAATTSRGARR